MTWPTGSTAMMAPFTWRRTSFSGIGFLGAGAIIEAFLAALLVLASNTLLRPVVNRINRRPVQEKFSEANHAVYAICSRSAQPEVREKLIELLEAVNYPVRDIEHHAFGQEDAEIEATLYATAIVPDCRRFGTQALKTDNNHTSLLFAAALSSSLCPTVAPSTLHRLSMSVSMLINCVAYENGAKLADIPVVDISEHIVHPGCFVWVALADATPAELDEMREEFGLHELAVEDARHGHQRPKIEEYGSSLFVVMHLLEPEPERPGHFNVGEVDVFVGNNYVLSVRNRSKQGFLGVRERCEREPDLLRNGSGFVLYALMDAVVDRYFPIIDALEVELEKVEQQIFTRGAARESIKQLYDLKQRVMVLKHAVAPLLEGASKLHGGRVPQICVGSQEYFRDVVDHLGRINGLIEGMRDTIGTAIQVNFSMVTIEENEVTKRLAAWASIFAICTAFVGIWGMNFENMPELKWRYGYAAALVLIASVCGYLYYRFRRAGWL